MSSPIPNERTLTEWAVIYAKRGWQIFPLHADKTPATQHGMIDATSDVETVTKWWTDMPSALIGCRVPADTIILDIDPRHGGDTTWDALCEANDYHGEARRWHASGRGDGGRHRWFMHPDPGTKLSTKRLDEWARQHGVGHQTGTKRWTAGIDLLHHGHRYTILPPSPHPDTGRPYVWGAERVLGPPPVWLTELLEPSNVVAMPDRVEWSAPAHPGGSDDSGESIADWFSATANWRDILVGWHLVAGDGDSDNSRWRHPNASATQSATIKHGCLFVYSPNTDFEVTETGDPVGYTKFRAYSIMEHGGDMRAAARAAHELRDLPDNPMDWVNRQAVGHVVGSTTARLVVPEADVLYLPAEQPEFITRLNLIDFPTLWAQDLPAEEWLCEPFLPKGRLVAIAAAAKTGKSLFVLDVCAALATGGALLGQPNNNRGPVHVLYLDMEMGAADLYERLDQMGYFGNELANLHYASLPAIPPLNTAAGGIAILRAVEALRIDLVVVDTRQRSIDGDENDANPVRDAYRYTFAPLKACGATVIRLDNTGKDVALGARGSSALRDDVDVEFKMDARDNNILELDHHGTSRLSWVPQKMELERREDPVLRHVLTTAPSWPADTKNVADLLDRLGVPVDMGRSEVRRTYGDRVRTPLNVLTAALKFRRMRASIALPSAPVARPVPPSYDGFYDDL